MTNESTNVNFFSIKNLVFKERNCSFNIFLDLENINDIAALYSYGLVFESILYKKDSIEEKKNKKSKNKKV